MWILPHKFESKIGSKEPKKRQKPNPLTVSKKQSLTVFDLDRTLIKTNSSFRFCSQLVRARILPISAFFYAWLCCARWQWLNLSLAELHHRVFDKILKGLSFQKLQVQAGEFVKTKLPCLWNKTVLHYLNEAQKRGENILILSSSPTFLVRAIGRYLGVDEAHGTDYEVDERGMLKSIVFLMEGKDKAAFVSEFAAKKGISLDAVTAFSDSFLDLPLLLKVGNPVAVNPDRRLQRLCKQKRWRIV